MTYPKANMDELKALDKRSLLKWINSYEGDWIKWSLDQQQEHDRQINDMRADLLNHPEHVALRRNLDDTKSMCRELKRQRDDLQRKVDILRTEVRNLSQGKKAGRPPLDQSIVDQIAELRGQGMTIRGIAETLHISKSAVAKRCKPLNG